MRSTQEEHHEVTTRLKYFTPEAERCLFPSLGGIYDGLAHPHCLEVLRMLRGKTSRTFRIATNGEALTREVVDQLANLRPVYLYVSLNTVSLHRRARLMRSQRPKIAADALPLLREQGIPYATVVLPWPVDSIDEMLEDLRTTVAYADEQDTHLVQVNLPGYTKYFPEEERFDLEGVWSAIVGEIRKLRPRVACPIVCMPSLYEENFFETVKNLPRVIGLVKNSPAALAGLQQGDLLRRVQDVALLNRPQARDLLSLVQRSGGEEISLLVERGRDTLELIVKPGQSSYPYDPETSNHLGIIFRGAGFRAAWIEQMRDTIKARGARHVLLLTSSLVRPTLEQHLAESPLMGDPQLRMDIEVPLNRFFGGNVFMGDLLVVQDFIDHISEYRGREGESPDLVLVPSSPFGLGQWGRDLTGRVYLEIERETGVPVELLEAETLYD
jgi:hypothetical protein